MAKIEMKGLDKYEKMLSPRGLGRVGILKYAVYDGAKVIADGVREAIESMPTGPTIGAIIAWRKDEPAQLTKAQKDGLLEGLGLSEIRDEDGFICTRLGFDGYNSVVTNEYPNGQPNAMIARSIESGTSARRKQPFVRPTVSRLRAKSIEEMEKALDKKISQIVKG